MPILQRERPFPQVGAGKNPGGGCAVGRAAAVLGVRFSAGRYRRCPLSDWARMHVMKAFHYSNNWHNKNLTGNLYAPE